MILRHLASQRASKHNAFFLSHNPIFVKSFFAAEGGRPTHPIGLGVNERTLYGASVASEHKPSGRINPALLALLGMKKKITKRTG